MSPTPGVKTLKIDGRDFSARPEETILDVARLVENEPSLAGLSGHLLLICDER